MSIGLFSLADSSLSEVRIKESAKKTPPKRIFTPTADSTAVPEPR